jgi:phenolic acid decarboxylase
MVDPLEQIPSFVQKDYIYIYQVGWEGRLQINNARRPEGRVRKKKD